jgi:hypothetical protein
MVYLLGKERWLMSPTFQVGDRVRAHIARGIIPGVIIEDRGPIGFRGRRLYQVTIPENPFETKDYELQEDEIEPLDESTQSAAALDKKQTIAFLKHGGLLSILRSNLSGGWSQPRVWLRPDSLGNVTHTFLPEWGVIGGQLVPFQAIRGDKILMSKREDVRALLQSFGLNPSEAEDVLSSVGTVR